MPRFRATIWVLSSTAEAVEGDAGITRRVLEWQADNENNFKADVLDRYALADVDAQVWFGPITKKG